MMEEKDRIERRSVIRPHIAVGPLEREKEALLSDFQSIWFARGSSVGSAEPDGGVRT